MGPRRHRCLEQVSRLELLLQIGAMSGNRGRRLAVRRLSRRLALPAFVAAFAIVAGSVHANDLCTTVGSSTTCSGNQSAGIALNPNNGITSLFVQSLTVPIGPTAGTPGINFQSLGANGVSAAPAGVAGSDLTTTTDTSVSISTTSGAPGIRRRAPAEMASTRLSSKISAALGRRVGPLVSATRARSRPPGQTASAYRPKAPAETRD